MNAQPRVHSIPGPFAPTSIETGASRLRLGIAKASGPYFCAPQGEEAAFTLMRSLSELMDGAVHEYGGIVQSFTGDGHHGGLRRAGRVRRRAAARLSCGAFHPAAA
jgi:hypothetical protein